MKKQTAIDWLIEQIFNDVDLKDAILKLAIQQAKEKEKEQIKDAFVECWKSNVPDGIECKLDAEQYYTSTYE